MYLLTFIYRGNVEYWIEKKNAALFWHKICSIHLTNIWFNDNYTGNQVLVKRDSLPSFTQVIKAPDGQHVREADGKDLELTDDLLTPHKEISLQEVVHGPYPVCQVHRVLPDLQERWGTCDTTTWDYIKDLRIHEPFSHVDLKHTVKSYNYEVIKISFLFISWYVWSNGFKYHMHSGWNLTLFLAFCNDQNSWKLFLCQLPFILEPLSMS